MPDVRIKSEIAERYAIRRAAESALYRSSASDPEIVVAGEELLKVRNTLISHRYAPVDRARQLGEGAMRLHSAAFLGLFGRTLMMPFPMLPRYSACPTCVRLMSRQSQIFPPHIWW